MASPTNDSEPESPDEEEIIETGFDPLLFWDQYRQIILLAGGAILLALVVFGVYEYNQSQRIAAAGAALSQAATDDDYRQIIDKYPGTVAAGDAALCLGGKLRAERKYDDALQVLQSFLDAYPNHPLVAAGDLSIAETIEAQRKIDDALAKYQEVAAKYPDSPSAPLAVLAQANILKKQGKIDDARRLFENFGPQFPDSVYSQEAMTEMRLLRQVPGASPAATPQPSPEGLPSILKSAPPAAAPPAPVAAPSAPGPLNPAASSH